MPERLVLRRLAAGAIATLALAGLVVTESAAGQAGRLGLPA